MGNHYVKVKSTCPNIYIVTFNQSDILYWNYRELRHVPLDGEVEVSGICAGGYVKVGVIYSISATSQMCCYDLFRVYHGGELTIKSVSHDKGVVKWKFKSGTWGDLLAKGRTIRVNAGLLPNITINSFSARRRHGSEDAHSIEESRRL